MVFPKRVFATTTRPFPNGAALAQCPVGVVRDLCGADWSFVPNGAGWTLRSADTRVVADVLVRHGAWVARVPRNTELARGVLAVLDALAFAGSVAADAAHVTLEGPSHFRFHAAQQRRADRQR